ncbi:MAG: metal-sensing transcriptional repressor [Clostridium sp.]|nr:metal-sensing transcriptional repressor [Clostridium sp.]
MDIKNNPSEEKVHVHPHDHLHEHFHSTEENHYHKHQHQNTKAVINRLARASGHLEAVKRMVESGKDCTEVLVQLAAVISALNNTGKIILQDHIKNCIVDAVECGDEKAIDDLNEVICKFIK